MREEAMRSVLPVLLAFVGAFVAGYLVAVVGSFLYIDHAGIFDRDGGLSMGTIFMIGPFAGIVAGLVAAIVVARLRQRILPRA